MSKDRIRDHYASHHILHRLTAALRASAGESVKLSPQTLALLDQFHRGGLASTGKLAERLTLPSWAGYARTVGQARGLYTQDDRGRRSPCGVGITHP